MTGEKRSSDLSSRLSVKRGGKLISKTLSKSSSPPSISAPPKAAVGASKANEDEVQRRKNSLHDMFRSSTKDRDGQSSTLQIPATDANSPSPSHGSRANIPSKALTARVAANNKQPPKHEVVPNPDSARLAELEAALVLAKKETAALQQELERVKQDAQASVEISRYQGAEKHRQPTTGDGIANSQGHHSSQHERADREEALISQNTELRDRLAELEGQLIVQSTYKPMYSEEDWGTLTLRLHEVEKESHSRLQQLLSLKSSISSLTRADSQASDNELADSFSQLANRVREWVVSNYRRTKMNFDDLPETTVQMLRSIKVNYKAVDGADKLALYQAIVSRMLMRLFEEPLVVGLPDQGIFAGLKAFLNGTQDSGGAYREWRRTTVRLIESTVQAPTVHEWKVRELGLLAHELEGIMRSMSSTELTVTARSALISIMDHAANLQRTLSLQKATYSVMFFGTFREEHVRFDDRGMEPVNDLECSPGDGIEPSQLRQFMFCVFPCLEKASDDIGNIIFKARVCCGVG